MENYNNNLLNEKISDETIKDIYKNAFKKKGINVKSINIDRSIESNVSFFNIVFSSEINYWIKWINNANIVYLIKIVNNEEINLNPILNPDVNSIINTIINDYKKTIKKQNFLKQILTLIFENVKK